MISNRTEVECRQDETMKVKKNTALKEYPTLIT